MTVSANSLIIKKCWKYTCKKNPSLTGHIYGQKLSEAKYEFYQCSEGYKLGEFLSSYRFAREEDMDLIRQEPLSVIKKLTPEQISILCHANGNTDSIPGQRSHFNRSDKENQDMAVLVVLGLMHPPRKFIGGDSYNWILTDLGKDAANSMLPAPRRKLES